MPQEYYNEESSFYSYKSRYLEFYGFLPLFPQRMLGSCSIEFKRSELSNMVVTFNHKQIFSLFETIEVKSNNYFFSDEFIFHNKIKFFIENVMLLLTKEEVTDMLSVIKNYYIHYIRELKKIASHLEIDKFQASREYTLGYRLFKIKIELWELMKRFANEHDYLKGKTEWYMFSPNWAAINVIYPIISHSPKYDAGIHAYFNVENTDRISDDYIWLVLNMSISKDFSTKLEEYNQRKIWGALTAYKWCINEFLPQIANAYKINNINKYIDDYYIKERLMKSKYSVISEIQMFYLSNNVYISETQMSNLKYALIYCLSKKELPVNEYDYILGKLRLRNIITLKNSSSQGIADGIISYLKKGNYERVGSLSSQADDYLRCILPFVDSNSKNRLSEEESDILIVKLNAFIKKMEDIEFLRRYFYFCNNDKTIL